MRALVDTNVVLDVLLKREPFHKASAQVFAAVEQSLCKGYLCSTTVTTIHYIAARHIGQVESRKCISTLLKLFEVSPVNRSVLELACKSKFNDFEDAVLDSSAQQSNLNCIVTRNTKDFQKSSLLVFTPEQFLAALASQP